MTIGRQSGDVTSISPGSSATTFSTRPTAGHIARSRVARPWRFHRGGALKVERSRCGGRRTKLHSWDTILNLTSDAGKVLRRSGRLFSYVKTPRSSQSYTGDCGGSPIGSRSLLVTTAIARHTLVDKSATKRRRCWGNARMAIRRR